MHRTKRLILLAFLTAMAIGSTGCASLIVAPIKAARELTGLAFDIADHTARLSIDSTKGAIKVAGAGVDLAGKIAKVARENKKVQVAQK